MKWTIPSIQAEVNQSLDEAFASLVSDEHQVRHYAALFDRSVEGDFYSRPDGPRGEGERPTWAPNPAYMDSLEALWIGPQRILKAAGLDLEKNLRQLFYESVEYKDYDHDHRRVFYGQLVDTTDRRPVTFFILNVPHSHEGFKYLRAPSIQIADTL